MGVALMIFLSWAMSSDMSSLIFSISKIFITPVCDIIWFSKNKRVFENSSTSFYSAKASIWARVKSAGHSNIGLIRNNIEDWAIINNLGITSRF